MRFQPTICGPIAYGTRSVGVCFATSRRRQCDFDHARNNSHRFAEGSDVKQYGPQSKENDPSTANMVSDGMTLFSDLELTIFFKPTEWRLKSRRLEKTK